MCVSVCVCVWGKRASSSAGHYDERVPLPQVNATVPWQLVDTLQEHWEDFWKENYPPDGVPDHSRAGQPIKLPAHFDPDEPDPDTGLFPGQGRLPRLSEFKNQTAVQTLLQLERDFGPGSMQTRSFLDDHLSATVERHVDAEFEPGIRWSKPPEPTDSEWEWCVEGLEELHQWSFADMCAYFERSRNWKNWSDSEARDFHTWAEAQQKEYKARELAAYDLYAKRRGLMGCKDPVRWKDLEQNDTTTPWDDFISEDFDPDINPQWPWNQPPTEAELWRWGTGPMRDLNATELKALMGKGKGLHLGPPGMAPRAADDDGDGDDDGSEA